MTTTTYISSPLPAYPPPFPSPFPLSPAPSAHALAALTRHDLLSANAIVAALELPQSQASDRLPRSLRGPSSSPPLEGKGAPLPREDDDVDRDACTSAALIKYLADLPVSPVDAEVRSLAFELLADEVMVASPKKGEAPSPNGSRGGALLRDQFRIIRRMRNFFRQTSAGRNCGFPLRPEVCGIFRDTLRLLFLISLTAPDPGLLIDRINHSGSFTDMVLDRHALRIARRMAFALQPLRVIHQQLCVGRTEQFSGFANAV